MINRLNLENNYREALKKNREISLGKKFVKYVGEKVLLPAVTEVAKKRVTKYLNIGIDTVENKVQKQYKLNKEKSKLNNKK